MAIDKAIDSGVLDANLTTVAQAIREKGGTTQLLAFPAGFQSAIESIETGITPEGSLTITENGTYDVTGKAQAIVNVLNNHLRFVYNNPVSVSGSGNYVTIASGNDILKRIRNYDSLIVIYRATGEASCTKNAIASNKSNFLPLYGVGAINQNYASTLRYNSEGGETLSSLTIAINDGTNIGSGSGRVHITENGDLQIFGNTNAYPILPGEIVVDVLWDEIGDYSGTLTDAYYKQMPAGVTLVAGQTYTLSMDCEIGVEPFTVGVGCGETSYAKDIAFAINCTNGRVSVTFTPTEEQLTNGTKLFFRCPRYNTPTTTEYAVGNIKLELGTA